MWHGHFWGLGWAGMIAGGFLMLLLWGSVITVVVLAIRALFARDQRPGAGGYSAATGDALHILKTRYARGEIDRDQYLEMRRDLKP
jgi:putative membrane protein